MVELVVEVFVVVLVVVGVLVVVWVRGRFGCRWGGDFVGHDGE